MAQLRQACEEGDVDVDQVIDDRGQRRSGSPTPRSGTPRQSDVLTSLTSLATSSSSSIQTLGQEAAQGVAGEVEVGDGPSLRENTPRTRPNGSLSRTNARPPLVHQGSASNMGSKLECLLRGAACLKGLHGGELSDESKEARVQGSKTLMEMSQEDTDAHTLSYQDYDDIDTDTDSDSDSGTSDIPPDTAAVDDAQRNSPKVAAEGKLIPAGSHPNAYSVESEPHQVARRKLKMDQPPMHSFNPESTQLENLSRYAWPPFKRTTSGSSSFDPARASRAQSNVTTSSGGGGNGQPTEHDALAEFIATPSDVIDQDAQELSNYQAPQMFGEAVLPDDEAQTSPGDTAAGRRGSAMDASASASRTQGDVQLSQKEHRRKHDAHSAEWHRLTQGVTRAPSQRDFVTEEQRHSSDGSDSGKIRLFHLLGARQRPAQQHQHQAQEQGHCGEEGDVREEHHGRTLYFLQDDSQLAVHLDQKAFDELEHAQMEKEQACRSLRMQQDDIKRREEADKEASASVVAANAAADVDGGANGKSSIASIDSDGDHERAGLEDGARGQSLSLPVSMGLAASDKVGESAKSTLQAQVRTESGLLGEQAVAQANEQGQEALVHSHIAPAISLEKKLDALKAEFGEVHLRDEAIKELGEERYLADAPAVLMRTVLIKGSLMLTSHRMCFLAFLPSSAELQRIHAEATKKQRQEGLAAIRRKKGRGAGGKAHADGAEEDGNDTEVAAADFGAAIVENPVLKKGPATEHRRGWAPKRRFWVELRADSISFYPSSDKLYEPLGSVGFDDFEELSPVDWRKATRVTFRAAGKERELEFSTEEAALGWRREIEAALWKFRHTAEKIHVDIPLARIRTIEHHSFLSFAACVQVLVQDDKVTEDDDGSENVSSVTEITFGMTNAQAFFEDTIEAAACRTAAWRERIGWDRTLVATPRPIISVDGPTTKEAAEDHAPSDDEEELHLENADEMTAQKAGRFIRQFSLRKDLEIRIFRVALVRTVPAVGSMSVNADHVCFWRRTVGSLADTKLRVPVSDLVQVETSKAFRWHHFGLTLHIKGHADLFFELNSEHERDDALRTIEKAMADAKDGHAYPDTEGKLASSKAKDAVVMDQEAVAVGPVVSHDSVNFLPKLVNPSAGQAPRLAPMRICIPVIGSRGDIQPFIALSKGLTAHGHSVCIVSHPEYEGWVSKHGIDFRLAGGDPGALMKLAVEHRLFSPAFFKESVSKFRAWLDELLREVFEGCYDADAIIEAPQTMAGIHIAERLGIPYFRAFTMPWTRTNAYPQAFSVPPVDMGTSYNSLSYTIFDQVFWRATSSQVNRWRKHMLGLKSTDFAKLDQDSVPFLYNFSGAVVPIPNDWDDHVCVSGYWFLDTLQNEWEAPLELIDFLEKAKADGKKIVYCGFGSIVVDDPAGLSQSLYEAVVKADVRAIIAKGWSGRMSEKKGKEDGEDSVKPPEECFVVDSIPHDWLFPRIDIAFHHGGAGTTGASIRAGLVTLIKPFFGDQFFWAQRVHKLGAGLRVASLDTSDICSALKKAAKSQIMIEKASQVGERIRAEHGVETAISFIYQNINRAKRTPRLREPAKAENAQRSSRISTSLSLFSLMSNASSGNMKTTSADNSLRMRQSLLKPSKHPSSESHGTSASSAGQTPESASSFERIKSPEEMSDAEKESSVHGEFQRSSAIQRAFKRIRSPTSISDEGSESGSDSALKGVRHKSQSTGGLRGLTSGLPSLPPIGLPKIDGLPSMSLPSVLKLKVKNDSDGASTPERVGTVEKPLRRAPKDETSRRTYQSAKDEDKRRATALAPKLEELALARKVAHDVV